MIRSILFSLVLLLTFPLSLWGQSTTVSATVVDSSSQAWSGGTYTISFRPVPNQPGPYLWNGSPLTTNQFTGTMNGSGVFSVSIPSSSSITPSGSQWTFTICPSAASPCGALSLVITGSSEDISSQVTSALPPVHTFPTPMGYAYADSQVQQLPGLGQSYFNTTQKVPKYWDGSAWQTYGSGNGTIQPTPQFRLFIQPNSGTQTVAGPASTSQNAVTPILQGTANTDLFATGAGNNGITNFFAGCGSNCVGTVPPTSTDTENLGSILNANTLLPLNSSLTDSRGNSSVLYQKNPSTSVNSPCNQGSNFFEPITFNCFASISTGNLDGGIVLGSEWLVSGHGYNSGSTGSSAVNWSTFHDIYLDPLFETRGIKQSLSIYHTDHAAGDSDPISIYGNFDGGCERGADECDKGFVDYPSENTSYFHGTIASGGATGATLLTTANTSGQNFFTDEGYLLDISKGTYTGTYSSQGTHDGYAVVNYTGASLPVSTAWGTLNTGTTSAANGKYQQYVSQPNMTVTLSADSPGAFVVGTNACMVSPLGGGFVEQLPITAVQAASGNQQTITFSTRYGWVSGSILMQGGMCGQIATNQASSAWRSGSLVVGSFSATQVLIGSCSPASCNDPNVYNVLGLISAGAVTAFYPGAEIIGTSNGTPNTVELANNTVAWANGDVIENPHPASVSIRGASILASQVSAPNGTTGAFGLDVGWNGPNCNYINCTMLDVHTPPSGHSMTSAICIGCFDAAKGTFADATVILPANNGEGTFWEDGGPSTGHNLITTSEGNRIISSWDSTNSKGNGFAFIATQTNLTVPIVGSNTPQHNATAAGMIPISYLDAFSEYLSDFKAITGDASVDNTGHWTNTGVNGAAVPVSAPVVGTNSSGQIISVPQIANVQIALPTSTIAANTCSAAINTTMTGVTTTSTFTSAFATDASGVTGYGSSGGLSIVMWPTANTNNLRLCNPTASSITPGAMTINVGAH